MFAPKSPVSWETPFLPLLDRIPYGVFLQIICATFEKGIIEESTFTPLFIELMVYFLHGLKEYTMNGVWDREGAHILVTKIVNHLPFSASARTKVVTDIVFRVEQSDSVITPPHSSLEDSIQVLNERMKQLASMKRMKMLHDSYGATPAVNLDDSHPYAKDMKQRYDRVKHSDLKDELLEYSLLKDMK